MGRPGPEAGAGPALSPLGAQGPPGIMPHPAATPSMPRDPAHPLPEGWLPLTPGWLLSLRGYTETKNSGKQGRKIPTFRRRPPPASERQRTALSQPHRLTVPGAGARTYSTIHNTRNRGNGSFFKTASS